MWSGTRACRWAIDQTPRVYLVVTAEWSLNRVFSACGFCFFLAFSATRNFTFFVTSVNGIGWSIGNCTAPLDVWYFR